MGLRIKEGIGMSVCKCAICKDIYDIDFQAGVDEVGNCICDKCWGKKAKEYGYCREDKIYPNKIYNRMDITGYHDCSNQGWKWKE